MSDFPSRDLPPSVPNPFSPALREDPYPVYRQLQERGSVLWHSGLTLWLVSGYEACQEALRADGSFKDYRNVPRFRHEASSGPGEAVPEELTEVTRLRRRWFLLQDPPEHTRLRSLVAEAFSSRGLEELGLEDMVRVRLKELLERREEEEELDLMEDLARPLVIQVLLQLLGLDALDQDLYFRWAGSLAVLADPGIPEADYVAANEVANGATVELLEMLRELVQEGSARRGVAAGLLEARRRGRLDEADLLATLTLLLFGGVDTTVNLLGNGLHALLSREEQWRLVVRNPDLAGAAVDEALRWDPPLQLLTRVVAEDISLAGTPIAAGQWLGILLGAANRDPRRFPDPARFDLRRPPAANLAFGRGIHTCVALGLALREGRIVFAELARRWPGLALASAARRRPTAVFRGFSKIPVRWRGDSP